MGFFPEKICDLKFLQILYFRDQNLKSIPTCIRNLTYLKTLDLSYNKIRELPTFVKELTHLKELYLADEEINVPRRNIFEALPIESFKENLSLKALSELFAELEKKEQTEREVITRKFNEQKEPLTVIFPPKEILSTFQSKSRKSEYIILWMLYNNDYCSWSDFKSDPVNISQATLSKYLSLFVDNRYVYRVSKGYYTITESGKKRISEIEKSVIK